MSHQHFKFSTTTNFKKIVNTSQVVIISISWTLWPFIIGCWQKLSLKCSLNHYLLICMTAFNNFFLLIFFA